MTKTLKFICAASLLLFISGFLSGCATAAKSTTEEAAEAGTGEGIEHFRVAEVANESAAAQVHKVEELEIIPTEINENVEKWINYFKNKGRPHMERYLLRSTRYEALMKKVLRDNKLPEDLFYVALIESGFSSQAFSHASAVGYWQFIRGTGKR